MLQILLFFSSKHIITSQVRAWNDTVRMAMLIDLILQPWAERKNLPLYLWMDKSIQVERGMLHLTEDDFFETIVDDDNDNDIDNNADI